MPACYKNLMLCAEQMQLPLPAALLRQLVEEWERVTKQGLLPALPRRPCIDELLDKFKASGSVTGSHPVNRADGIRHPPSCCECTLVIEYWRM